MNFSSLFRSGDSVGGQYFLPPNYLFPVALTRARAVLKSLRHVPVADSTTLANA